MYIKKSIYLFLLFSMIKCGNNVLEEVGNFHPNKAPAVQSINVTDQLSNNFVTYSGSSRTYTSNTWYIEPGRVYYLSINLTEYESDLVNLSYEANSYENLSVNPADYCNTDISGLTPNVSSIGNFNNAQQSVDYQESVTATVTYASSAAPPMLVNSDIYVTVTSTDDKDATSTFTFCLAPVKRTPVLTEVSTFNVGDASNTVSWSGDGGGTYFYIPNGGFACAGGSLAGYVTYPYTQGQVIQRADLVYSDLSVGAGYTILLLDSIGQRGCIQH